MRIIAGKYRGKKLCPPQSLLVRPTSDRARESLFNILNSRLENLWQEYRLLDVFSGTGAFALEAVSRGIEEVCLVDLNTSSLKPNLALFPAEKSRIRVLNADALKLPSAEHKYNLVFMDAPYGKGLSEPALEQLHLKNWLEAGTLCLVEVEKKEEINIPSCYEFLDERIYGLAKILFLNYLG